MEDLENNSGQSRLHTFYGRYLIFNLLLTKTDDTDKQLNYVDMMLIRQDCKTSTQF